MEPNRLSSFLPSHVLRVALVLAMLVAAGACACKDGSKAGGTTGPTTGKEDASRGNPADCDNFRGKVETLYRAQADAEAKPDDTEEVRALRAQTVEDNTHMVLADCKKEPARFQPCLEKVTSVEAMERDCLIPLDDEGTVEGKAFGGK